MKKIYQKPTINIVKVKVGHIMNIGSEDYNPNPESANKVDGSQALGRAWYEWGD